jgi:hypothetical protein
MKTAIALSTSAASVAVAAVAFLVVSHTSHAVSHPAELSADTPSPAATPSAAATSTGPALPAAEVIPTDPLSASTLRDMADSGFTLKPVDPSAAKPAVSVTDAVRSAGGNLHFVNDGGKASEVSLGLLTDSFAGKQLETDMSKPSRIDPEIQDRLVIAIDAATGENLRATQVY